MMAPGERVLTGCHHPIDLRFPAVPRGPGVAARPDLG